MKNICKLLSVLLCITLVGCGQSKESPTTTQTGNTSCTTTVPTSTVTEETTVTQPKIPEIYPDTIGIYIPAANGTAARKRITEFTSSRTPKKDIDCFEIIASHEDTVNGRSFASLWTEAWNSFTDTKGTKIGFHIEFSLKNGKTVAKQLLKPSDSQSFFEYLEIYMYDDIHQTPGVWYTHLEDTDCHENTMISSIKLTAGSKIAQVEDIYLSAFFYNGPDCFDSEGQYIGGVLETISILPE